MHIVAKQARRSTPIFLSRITRNLQADWRFSSAGLLRWLRAAKILNR